MKIRTSGEEYEIADDLLGHSVTERMISDFLLEPTDQTLNLKAEGDYDPTPYNRILKGLVIRKTEGPTKVEEKEEWLVASGSIENLEGFSTYFGFDDNATKGSHHHFDYLTGNQFVHPDTVDLVVALEINTEQGEVGNA